MILALLSLVGGSTLAPANGAAQEPREALLHPADTVFLAEIPDVPALLAAYERAPLVQMISDATVRETVADVLDAFEVELASQVEKVLLELGVPAEIAADPGAAALGHLRQAGALSFSLSVDRERAEALAGHVLALVQAKSELAEIETALAAARARGEEAASLADLGLEAPARTDPWDRPYVLGDDGSVRSLGADGAPGGEGRDADVAATHDLRAVLMREVPAAAGALLHLRLTSDDAAARAFDLLALACEKAGLAREGAQELDYAGGRASVIHHAHGSLPGVPAWTMRAGSELALGIGKVDPASLAARRAGTERASAAAAYYDALLARLPASSGTTLFQAGMPSLASFGGLKGLAESMRDHGQIDLTLGLGEGAGAWRMQLVDDRFVTDALTEGSLLPPPLAGHFGHRPIPADLWNFVPEDAIGLLASTLDGPGLYSEVSAEIGEASDARAKLAEVEERYRFSLEKDVFGALGGGVVGYLLPIKGITGLPEFAIAVELDDAAAFQRGLEGLLALLAEQAAGEFTVKNRPYRDTPLWTFSFPEAGGAGGMLAMGFSPSITIVQDHLLLTISSLRAKREIKRVLREEGGALALGPYAPPPEAVGFAYMDWAAFLNGVYDGVRAMIGLMGAMGGGEGLPIDPSALPDAQTFTRFFRPTVAWSRPVPGGGGGTQWRYESSFGPETWLGLGGGAAAAVLGVRSSRAVARGPELVAIEEETYGAEDAPEVATEAEIEATREAMRGLAQHLAAYRIERQSYPARLADLVAPTDARPRGFLDGGELPTDAWGRAFSYELGESGYKLWSRGADGLDQRGGGDDIVGG